MEQHFFQNVAREDAHRIQYLVLSL
jgi:hypothetical protein